MSYFVSSGDTGGVVEYPSSSPNVVSVGGTSLATSPESAWSSGGGGCSAYEKANSAQYTAPGVNCGGRATPDVASDADPNSGLSVYDSTSYNGQTGWFQVGGTSAASPVWAARAADRAVQVNAGYVYAGYNGSTFPYGSDISYRDVTSGNNGYAAGTGYDLATGLGSWINGDSGVAPPTGLTASVSGGTSVVLNWTASPTSGVSYNVYRSNISGGELSTTAIANVAAGTTTFTDGPLGSGTYYYEVTAVSSGGSASGPSNEASATIGSPAQITSKSCSGASCSFTGTGVNPLSWNFGDNTTGSGGSVNHTYTTQGTFPVTLTAGDGSSAATSVTCSLIYNKKRSHLSCS